MVIHICRDVLFITMLSNQHSSVQHEKKHVWKFLDRKHKSQKVYWNNNDELVSIKSQITVLWNVGLLVECISLNLLYEWQQLDT